MPTLNHRHQPSTTSTTSSSSSSSSSRPALQHILTNSPSNAVHLSRSTAPTSRQVRSHWMSHFALNWRRSSRASKFILAFSLTLVAMQVIAAVAVLTLCWEMFCDRPLRVYVTVYILRLCLSCPLSIYLHFAPRRRQNSNADRAERGEIYAMTERSHAQLGLSARDSSPRTSLPPPATTFLANSAASRLPSTDTLRTRHALYRDPVLVNWIDRTKSALDLFAVLWFVVGNYMLFTSTTCSETAIPLYYLSLVFIIYGYILLTVPILLCAAVIFCLPCVLVGMRLIHVEDGVDMGGASPEEIAKIPVFRFKSHASVAAVTVSRATTAPVTKTCDSSSATTPVVITSTSSIASPVSSTPNPFIPMTPESTSGTRREPPMEPTKSPQASSPQGFASRIFDRLWTRLGFSDLPADGTGSHEVDYEILEIPNEQDQVCAICLSMYEDDDVLCKLWCNHHFHKTCVHQWLALNSRCPMCKRDSRGKDHSPQI